MRQINWIKNIKTTSQEFFSKIKQPTDKINTKHNMMLISKLIFIHLNNANLRQQFLTVFIIKQQQSFLFTFNRQSLAAISDFILPNQVDE